ncbi:helix-turn-helix domain-containing protein [Alkaliphilus crotonatoxidans]
MKIMSTGEKIRKLRTDIGLNQDDLTNDEITRSLISMIENNKRNLTYRAATVIASALNQYYPNLGKEITPDFLLETEVEQAQRLIKEKLDDMQQLLKNPSQQNEAQVENGIKNLIEFAQEWKLDSVVAELQMTRGRFYYDTYQYNEALQDFFCALAYYLKKEQYEKVASLYNLIGISHYSLMLIEQALLYFAQLEDILYLHKPQNYDRMKMLLVINRVLCYRRQKKYDMVLNGIAQFKELNYYDQDFYQRIVIIEANTYRDIQHFDKAIKLYNKMLKKPEKLTTDNLMLVYENLAELYEIKEDYEKSMYYAALAYDYQDKVNNFYIPYLFLLKAKLNFKLNKIDKAVELINQGLMIAEKVSGVDKLIDLHFLQMEIDLQTKQYFNNLHQLEKLCRNNWRLSKF